MAFRSDLLKGKTALITGGGSGIGRGLALALAEHGCNVAVAGRRPEPLAAAVDEIRAQGVLAAGIPADVRDPVAVAEAVEQAAGLAGRLDILVNNAAGNFLCRAEDLSPNGFGAVVDIDLKGSFHAAKAALPHLKARGGVVLNISSTLQYVGTAAQIHVSAAKAGVDALTRVLAVEWGGYGIRVNGIAPGPVADTEGVKRLLVGPAKAAAVGNTPLGRLGSMDDVSNAALFICSDAAAFVTGVTLVVDGGLWLASTGMTDAWAASVEQAGS